MKETFVNLKSFAEIFESKDSELIKSFIKLMDSGYSYEDKKGMSDKEIDDFASLSHQLIPHLSFKQLNGYFIGYVVSIGIREEFDILRFSENTVLNIELKSSLPEKGMEGIKDQLLRHRFLLRLLNKEIITCTFVNDLNTIFLLYEEEELIEITMDDLAKLIPKDYILKNELSTIDLSKSVISPYSQTHEFSEHLYFLNSDQKKARDSILETDYKKISITGGPGTGKTLLLLDLAKVYQQQGTNVVVIFTGKMDDYERISNEIGINVVPIKKRDMINFDTVDIILIDEAQRLYKEQYDELFQLKNKKIIFSTDHQQTLHEKEKVLYIEKLLEENPEVFTLKLKEKIRTDAPMASFIMKFLDLKSRKIQPYDYNNVQVVYFNNKETASTYIKNMCEIESYVSIEQTEYVTKENWVTKRRNIYPDSESSHSVIGREYDNVLVPLDEHFSYSDEGKLISTYGSFYPYHERSCIFEALTRVKKKLLIVVIDNPNLYTIIQQILSWKNDKLYSK